MADGIGHGGTVARVPNQQETNSPAQPEKPQRPAWRSSVIASTVMVLLTLTLMARGGDTATDATLKELDKAVSGGKVESAQVDTPQSTITLTMKDGTKLRSGYVDATLEPLVESLSKAGVEVQLRGEQRSSTLMQLLMGLGPMALLIGALVWVTKKMPGSGLMNLAKNTKDAVAVPDTNFADVAGANEAVEDLREVVEFLKANERFERLGARVPKGVLLEGPPGTGKTLLARATAGEAGVPFFALSGSDFVQLYVGVGASRVRSVFEKARKSGRAIVFIDEIDAIGRARSTGTGGGAHEERENTLNALLVEMDGFEASGVVVIAATNRADILDAALLRPGRFDRRVPVTIPDRKGREELFELYLDDASLAETESPKDLAERLASRSMGMTGADISAVVNEAALSAAKDGSEGIEARHLHDALERVALGRERRSITVSDWAKKVTAWHEAGHALCAMYTDGSWKPERVSIVPRGAAGGATWFSTDDETFITRSSAFAELVVGLGGRAAEELILDGDITQGASNDLAQATARAERMVCDWGMYGTLVRVNRDRLMGEDAKYVRERVEALLQEAMDMARALVAEHRESLDAIAEALIERETLDRDELAGLVTRD
jgi:cell division protease FtsH